MSDILNIGTTADADSPGSSGTSLDTGVLRRKYNFGDRVSELSLAQDPFFRFLTKVSKKPTDDPSFKFTEKRGSYMKRYAYVSAWVDNSGVVNSGGSAADADMVAFNDGGAPGSLEVGDKFKFYLSTDYKSAGNVQNIYGQSSGAIAVGATGTEPTFFLPGQLIKVPFSTTDGGGGTTRGTIDYVVLKLTSVTADSTVDSREAVLVVGEVVRDLTTSSCTFLANFNGSDEIDTQTYDEVKSDNEYKKVHVIGSVFDKGTGYPETWKDQPYSTGYGQTQIWKTTMAMDNTDRATVLKYEGNEWARIWKEKLIEHKWDIEQSLLFGSQDSTYRTTMGAVPWVLANGNIFSMDLTTKTQDKFLDDLSVMLDPRYNNANATVFFCDTATYNWMHKLSGYFANNIGATIAAQGNTSPDPNATNSGAIGRYDFAAAGRKNIFGIDVTTISTVYGDMNCVRNVHLDSSDIKMLGVNMKHCAYRPLVGNGINRDTSIYVGVQTLENSGVDRRVDQILTEAGMEWCCPETHAIWI